MPLTKKDREKGGHAVARKHGRTHMASIGRKGRIQQIARGHFVKLCKDYPLITNTTATSNVGLALMNIGDFKELEALRKRLKIKKK